MPGMTNLRYFLVLALFCVLVGCKKDEEYGSFIITSDMSMDFEYGQTKEVTYETEHVAKHNAPTDVPEGWTCVHRDGKYYITAPTATAIDVALTGSIQLSVTSTANAMIPRRIAVAVRMAEEITQPANCYIVTEPATRYKFNALRRGNETAESIVGAVSGVRVWSTSSTALSNVSYENGYLYFATGGFLDAPETLDETNAVVAVVDKDGEVLWSWHIWVTPEDPTRTTYRVGDHWVMDRNLGAFSASGATAEEAGLSYGLYYQWGRKDPFVGPEAWNSPVSQQLYAHKGGKITHEFEVVDADTSMEYVTSRPGTFFAGGEEFDFNWYSGDYNYMYNGTPADLWGAGGGKTVFDPCPAGWRVAPREVFASFTVGGEATSDAEKFNVVGGYEYGWTFDAPVSSIIDTGARSVGVYSGIASARTRGGSAEGSEVEPVVRDGIFFPAAGRRSFSPSLATRDRNYTNIVNDENGIGWPVGFYWTNTFPAPALTNAMNIYESTGAALVFRHDYINPAAATTDLSSFAPAGGFPVRCVAE